MTTYRGSGPESKRGVVYSTVQYHPYSRYPSSKDSILKDPVTASDFPAQMSENLFDKRASVVEHGTGGDEVAQLLAQ